MKLPSTALGILALVAVLMLMQQAKTLLLPLTIAIFLCLLLSRPLTWMTRRRCPRMLAALILTFGFITLVGAGIGQFIAPLERWLARAPEALDVMQEHGDMLRGRLENLAVTAQQLEALADRSIANDRPPVQVEVDNNSTTRQAAGYLFDVLYGITATALLLFFLLAHGHVLLRRLVNLGRSRESRRRIIQVARSVEAQFYRFLATITAMNLTLALITAVMLSALNVPDAWLWGVMAGALNYAPYVGTMISTTAITVASATAHDSLLMILLPGGLYLILNGLEASMLTPSLLGERLSLNPLFVFLAILFFGWLWGAAGMFVAVPLLVILKVVLTEVGGAAHPWSRILAL